LAAPAIDGATKTDMKNETKLKHTPAPWHEAKLGDVNRMFIYTDWHKDEDGADRRDEIAIIDTVQNAYPCLPEATAQANARLIAAAPDLLDALMHVVALLHATYDALDEYVAANDGMLRNPLGNKRVQDIADMATDALTKAIGETQE
jgi:hypothetical protein